MRNLETATFAGGCFWCMQAAFRTLKDVTDVVAGYTGGQKESPSYEDVCSGTTGHYEAIQVTFDPSKISYEELLNFFWKNIDPTDAEGQFADKGTQYISAIFYHDEKQRKLAEISKNDLTKSGKFESPIATKIIKFIKFFKAETYHQDYSKKNPVHYKLYAKASGREDYVKREKQR
jgi:methionine-S-sulfoxide reductase